ncbi:AtzG-like protein [Thiomonas sp. FB-Cd]|uniref:AtzG-like protein n=1 Tax=Thiomonas sp. FB-Cd TaxID=1158292 RepID=UPI000B07760D|nr:AtzG-like protein [Thiomonas sp. FB-Cd]
MNTTDVSNADADMDLHCVRVHASLLRLAMNDEALCRISAQWRRLRDMADRLDEQVLTELDEPAPVFRP